MSRKNFEVEYLREFEAIFKNIKGVTQGQQGGWIMKKNGGQKSRDTAPLSDEI